MRLLAAVTFLLLNLSLHAEDLFALTASGKVFRFSLQTNTTSQPISYTQISGLQPSETILGIDFRPATGQLIGLGSTSRLYVIDPVSSVATAASVNPFNTLLSGVRFGIDFNPTVDRLRIVSDTAQSLRAVPDTGALQNADTNLAYATLDPFVGASPRIVSAAYTNNLSIATSTTLYAIDSTLDTLVTIGSVNSTVSPNGGQLFTVGKLGIDATDFVGFDISGQTGTAYLSNTNALNETTIYTVNLTTGSVSPLGPLVLAGETIIDLALAVPPTTFDMVVLRAGGQLSRFDSRFPAVTTPQIGIIGLQNGETIREIDFRPLTGDLTGLGSTGRIYTINPFTGAAVLRFPDPLNPLPASFEIGFDFNPALDAIRIVNDAALNSALSAAGAYALQSNLAYAAGDPNAAATPSVVAAAYANNVANAPSTTLFYIDQALGILATTASPASGALTTVGSLGLGTNLGTNIGFDIAPSGVAFLSVGNSLYTVNLVTGATTLIGSIGGGSARGIAAVVQTAQPSLQLSAGNFSGIEGGPISVQILRSGSLSGTVSVDYFTTDGTATAPLNYTRPSGTLTLLNGEASQIFTIPTINDNTLSLSKTAIVSLANPVAATLGAQSTAILTIFDVNDIDSDGFPNDVETVFGSDPNSGASTPFGASPAGPAQPLTVSKATVKLNFAKPVASDSVSFAGTFPNIAAIPVAKATVEIGSVLGKPGVVLVFNLDAKGKSTPKGLTVGAQKNGVSKVAFSASKGTFAAALAAAGLTNINATKAPLPLNFTLYFNNLTYSANVNMLYTAKQGKSGSAIKAK